MIETYVTEDGRKLGRFDLARATPVTDDLLRTAQGKYLLVQNGSFLADAGAVKAYCAERGLKVPGGATDYGQSLGGRRAIGPAISIRVPPETLAELQAIATVRHLPLPEIARRAIRAGLSLIGG